MSLNFEAPNRNFNKTLQPDLPFGDQVTNVLCTDLSSAKAAGICPPWGLGA